MGDGGGPDPGGHGWTPPTRRLIEAAPAAARLAPRVSAARPRPDRSSGRPHMEAGSPGRRPTRATLAALPDGRPGSVRPRDRDRVPAGGQQWWAPATDTAGPRGASRCPARRLRDVAGPGADALRVHDDAPADAFARALRRRRRRRSAPTSTSRRAGGRETRRSRAARARGHPRCRCRRPGGGRPALRTDGGMAAEEAAASTAAQRARERPRPTARNVSDRPEHGSQPIAAARPRRREPAAGHRRLSAGSACRPLSLTGPAPAPADPRRCPASGSGTDARRRRPAAGRGRHRSTSRRCAPA